MDAIGGLLRSIGDGLVGLLNGAFEAIGAALRGVVGTLQGYLPGLWFPVVVFVVLLIVAWNFAKR